VSTATRPAPPRGWRPPHAAEHDDPEIANARRRTMLWSLGVLTVFIAVAVGVCVSPVLDVEEIQVVGAAPERVDDVQRAAGVDVGDAIVLFLPSTVAGNVRDLPWVRSVSVTRDFPTTVRIAVTEREPVGWVRTEQGALVVDAGARALWRADAPPPGLPELIGAADIPAPGGLVRPQLLASVAETLGRDLRSRAATVTLADATLSIQIAFGPQLRFGAPRDVAAKARVAGAVLTALGPTPASYIDVTVPTAPVSG
jgi:cell division protein FtsQ